MGWDGKYADYLQTEHWRRLRDRELAARGYRCERCGEHGRRGLDGNPVGIQLHHLTYDRLGAELATDLEALCVTCHQAEHGIAVDDEETRNGNRRRISQRITARSTGHLGDEIDAEVEAWDRLAEQAGL
jgi:5-methylcytosine-specific restriction endonuclease McrA